VDPKLQIAKLEKDNRFYIKELARVQKEYAKLVKKYKRSQKDLKATEISRDSLTRSPRPKNEKTKELKRGPRGWPI